MYYFGDRIQYIESLENTRDRQKGEHTCNPESFQRNRSTFLTRGQPKWRPYCPTRARSGPQNLRKDQIRHPWADFGGQILWTFCFLWMMMIDIASYITCQKSMQPSISSQSLKTKRCKEPFVLSGLEVSIYPKKAKDSKKARK